MIYFTIPITILNKSWTIRLISKKRFKRKHGDFHAITATHKRYIDLKPKHADLETIIHELFHAYYYELCLDSTTKLTLADQEEIFAELMAHYGRDLLDLAERIERTIQVQGAKL